MSKELEPRNQAMYQLYANGKSMQTIADTFGISRQRAAQIIARYARDGLTTDDESRALHRAQLEGMLAESLAMFYAPASPKFDVKGVMLRGECQEPECNGCIYLPNEKIIRCNHGEPVPDLEGKIHAGTLALKVSENLRRMDAIDKPRRKQLPENEALLQMQEWLAKLPQGEVITDIPGEPI